MIVKTQPIIQLSSAVRWVVARCGGMRQEAQAGGLVCRREAGSVDKGLAVGHVGRRSCPLRKRKRTAGVSPHCSLLVELKVLSFS